MFSDFWNFFMEDSLRCSASHDAASTTITAAAIIVMIHSQVMAHLMGHHSGVIWQGVVTELRKQNQYI